MKGNKPLVIRRRDVMKSIRIPLPKQTGGRHKDVRRISRQNQKITLRLRGEE
jgi:hypothetical protein